MLAATGVAGDPNSFFREPSIEEFADRWGVPHPEGMETAAFDRDYLAAMQRTGRAGTDIFGLRIMRDGIATATQRFDRTLGGHADIAERFDAAFGRPLYIHLSREDKVAQAISLYRAEQSGLWHLHADGSVLEGDGALQPVAYDENSIAAVVDELTGDDAAWSRFFADRDITPLRLTYEAISADPKAALGMVLSALGLNPAIAAGIAVPTAKIGDGTSAAWAERFNSARTTR